MRWPDMSLLNLNSKVSPWWSEKPFSATTEILDVVMFQSGDSKLNKESWRGKIVSDTTLKSYVFASAHKKYICDDWVKIGGNLMTYSISNLLYKHACQMGTGEVLFCIGMWLFSCRSMWLIPPVMVLYEHIGSLFLNLNIYILDLKAQAEGR